MLVVDASALLQIVLAKRPDPGLAGRVAGQVALCAPELIDLELLQALRGMLARAPEAERHVEAARRRFGRLRLVRFPHEPLADRVWQLRGSLTACDAAYVALAEGLRIPLATCDARIARAPGHDARIELYEATR